MFLIDKLRPRTVETGKIKLGGKGAERPTKSGGKFRLPVKYDHFVITGLNRDAAGNLAPDMALMASLAEEGYADPDGKLRQIPVVFLSNDIHDIIQSAWLWYGGKKIIGKSDGETVWWYANPQKPEERYEQPRQAKWEQRYEGATDPKGNRLFKLNTTLNCIIASKQANWGGVYKLRTTSQISAEQLVGSIRQLSMLCGGHIKGVPFRLRMRPMAVTPNGQPSTVYVVHVDMPAETMLEVRERALKIAAMEAQMGDKLKQFEIAYKASIQVPGDGESETEQADIQEEFYPDATEADKEEIQMPQAVDEAPAVPGIDTDPINAAPPAPEPADDPERLPAVENYTKLLSQKPTVEAINLEVKGLKAGLAPDDYKIVRKLIWDYAKVRGWTFDKAAGKFVEAVAPSPAEEFDESVPF